MTDDLFDEYLNQKQVYHFQKNLGFFSSKEISYLHKIFFIFRNSIRQNFQEYSTSPLYQSVSGQENINISNREMQ